MFKRYSLIFAASLLIPSAAMAQDDTGQEAQETHTLEGFWAFQIDDAVIFLFEVDQREDGSWRARWTRPAAFDTNGVIFQQMSGARRIVADSAEMVDGNLQLSFPDPRPEAVPNVFLFEQTSDHQVTMTYVGTPLEPFPLIRVWPSTELGPFNADRLYDRDNAVLETDYVAPPPPVEAEPEPAEADDPDAVDIDVVEDAEPAIEGISEDFLDGMEVAAEAEDAVQAAVAVDDADLAADVEPDDASNSRSCADLDGDLSVSALNDLWGDDFTQLGDGLDIREYTLDNGDVARVTMLGERVYVNSCGAAE